MSWFSKLLSAVIPSPPEPVPEPAPPASTFSQEIERQLRRDEGEILHEYKDHLGYSTIGIGRLIDKRKGGGISKEESSYLFANDLANKTREVEQALPWVKNLDDARRGVLINMAFQMGTKGLLGFENTLAMVERGDYNAAASGMLNSLWAREQTPERAKRLSDQMRDGRWR